MMLLILFDIHLIEVQLIHIACLSVGEQIRQIDQKTELHYLVIVETPT